MIAIAVKKLWPMDGAKRNSGRVGVPASRPSFDLMQTHGKVWPTWASPTIGLKSALTLHTYDRELFIRSEEQAEVIILSVWWLALLNKK